MAKLIGTAGHVDHGKTTLIQALTGIDADRLKEEKSRGMTIDIGFAWMDLPEVGRVSIVDVPGHQRFLTNMLVGALGMNLAMLCIAADAKIMPQTIEHLEILSLIPLEHLVVVLTRKDLASAESILLLRKEVDTLLKEKGFSEISIFECSAKTGVGLEELKSGLVQLLKSESHQESRAWYLPIDRVFNVKGSGMVVTGTLVRGSVEARSEAVMMPSRKKVRIRSIQTHHQTVQKSEAGMRTALNLVGVKPGEISRGEIIGAVGTLYTTSLLDAQIKWVDLPKHGSRIRLAIGATEVMGRVFLNSTDSQIVQISCEKPIGVAKGQALIIRSYSPQALLGGGVVVTPLAKKRKSGEESKGITTKSVDHAVLDLLKKSPTGIQKAEVCRLLGQTGEELKPIQAQLTDEGKLLEFFDLWFDATHFEKGVQLLMDTLQTLHQHNSRTAFVPKDKVLKASGLKWSGKALDRILFHLVGQRKIKQKGSGIALFDYSVQLNSKQEKLASLIAHELEKSGANVPSPTELSLRLNVPIYGIQEVLALGLEAGLWVEVFQDIFYTAAQLEGFQRSIVALAKGKEFYAADFRSALDTSRKYTIPILEYFDSIGFTTRIEDKRFVNENS